MSEELSVDSLQVVDEFFHEPRRGVVAVVEAVSLFPLRGHHAVAEPFGKRAKVNRRAFHIGPSAGC